MGKLICEQCGAEIEPETNFCGACGKAISEINQEVDWSTLDLPQDSVPENDRIAASGASPVVSHEATEENTEAPKKRAPKKSLIGIIVGVMAIAIIAVIALVNSNSESTQLQAAAREPGQLPNIPAVIAQANKWDANELESNFAKLMGSNSMPVFDDLDKKEFGMESMMTRADNSSSGFMPASRWSGSSPSEVLLTINLTPKTKTASSTYYVSTYRGYLCFWAPDNSGASAHKLISSGIPGTDDKALLQTISDIENETYYYRYTLPLNSTGAGILLGDLGIKDFDIIKEQFDDVSLATAINSYLKSGGRASYGKTYNLLVRAKDAIGKDFYIHVHASLFGNLVPFKDPNLGNAAAISAGKDQCALQIYAARDKNILIWP